MLAFERCVIYYRQHKQYEKSGKIEVSYSGLFNFTDASILSKFASVSNRPEVVTAIMKLKAAYFQVGRHVEDASELLTFA